MNYSFFLFSKLFDVVISHDYEYDLMFNDISILYQIFLETEYNNPNEDEYSCIVKFLRCNVDYIKSQQYLSDNEDDNFDFRSKLKK